MRLYDQLMIVAPTPVVALNRAVAVAEMDGPDAGLRALAEVELPDYQPFHVARAELLSRVGRRGEAIESYTRALDLTTITAEREHLAGRLRGIRAG